MDENNDDPLDELARIFAAAILRLKVRQALPKSSALEKAPQNSLAARLELSADTALTVVHAS